MNVKLWYILIISCIASSLHSQYQEVAPTYEIEWINLNHTSPPGFYHDIVQDQEGYVWIASSKGVHVFDGNNTITYADTENPFCLDSLVTNWEVRDLLLTKSGHIYIPIYFESKILQLDPQTRDVIHTITLDSSHQISQTMHEVDKGVIFHYANSNENKYYTCRLNKDYSYDTLYQLPYDPQDFSDRIFSTEAGRDNIFILKNENITEINQEGTLLNEYNVQTNYHSLYGDKNGNYSSTNNYNEIVKLVQGKSESYFTLPTKLENRISKYDLFENLIIGSKYNALVLFDIEKKTYQNLSDNFTKTKKRYSPLSITEESIKIIRENNTDNFFLLTSSSLFRIRPIAPKEDQYRIAVLQRDAFPSMREITKTADGDIVASYYSGLAKLDTNENIFKPIKLYYPDDQKIERAYSLLSHENILFWNNAKIDQSGNVTNLTPNKGYNHTCSVLKGDSLIMIPWESQYIYMYDLQKDTALQHKLEPEIYIERKSSLYQTNEIKLDPSHKSIWISTAYNGIVNISFDGKLLKKYYQKQLLPNRDYGIYDFEMDKEKIYYASGNGLSEIDINTNEVNAYNFPYLNQYNQKIPRIVYTIEKSNEKEWYLGTSKGLILFNIENKSYKELESNHPLANIEYNRKGSKKIDNTYYMGTTLGMYSFKKDELTWQSNSNFTSEIKPMRLQAMQGTTKVDLSLINDKYIVQPNSRNIETEFSIPNHKSTTLYSYRLVNLDSTWSEFSTDNKFTIYSLPAGEHTLEVKATRNQTETNTAYTSVTFLKSKVWYKRWWAVLSYIGLTGFSFYLFYRYRVGQIKKYERLRTRISSDLHDDVGTLLTSVAMQSEILGMDAPPEKIQRFEKLSTLSREAMSRMRDTVWAIDSRKDNTESLVDRMNDFLTDINHQNRFKIKFESQLKNVKLPPDIRQNMYLIFKEAITNAFKYSNGNQIHITLTQSKTNLALRIHDNGTVDRDQIKSSGTGISNMKMRAKRIGLTCSIDTDNGFFIKIE